MRAHRPVLTGDRDGCTEPNPSPDGRSLSYVRTDEGVEFQQALTVGAADGSAPRDVVPPEADVAVRPAGPRTARTSC